MEANSGLLLKYVYTERYWNTYWRETICMWYVWETVYTERKSQNSPDYTLKWFTAIIRKSLVSVQSRATIGQPAKHHLNDQ